MPVVRVEQITGELDYIRSFCRIVGYGENLGPHDVVVCAVSGNDFTVVLERYSHYSDVGLGVSGHGVRFYVETPLWRSQFAVVQAQ